MGVAEVAELLDVSRQYVNRLVQAGHLPEPVAILSAGRIWNAEDIERWAAGRKGA